MGMYSYFECEDIEVIDMKGLKAFLERWEKEFGRNETKDYKDMFLNILKKDDKGKEYVSFEDWNDIKLISYWYDTEDLFLKCVAKYLRGSVNWNFENHDEAGWVEFRDGECIIHTGTMNWYKSTPESMMRELTDKQKEFMLINDI